MFLWVIFFTLVFELHFQNTPSVRIATPVCALARNDRRVDVGIAPYGLTTELPPSSPCGEATSLNEGGTAFYGSAVTATVYGADISVPHRV